MFATSIAFAAGSAPAMAQSHHNGFHPGLPTCGSPYKCFNFSGLEGLGVGATWVNNLDPVQVTDVTSGVFDNMIYGQLVNLAPAQLPPSRRSATNANGWVIPGLASSVTLSSDQKNWTFHLRSGLKFADGEPITPFDVKWSIARAGMKTMASYVTDYYDGLIKGIFSLNNDSNISSAMSDLSGVTYDNSANTVTITATQVAPYFLESLTYPTTSVLNPGCPSGCYNVGDLSHATDAMSLAGSAEYTGGGGSGNPEWLDGSCESAQESSSRALMPACYGAGNPGTAPGGTYYPNGSTPTLTMEPNPNYYGTKAKYVMKNPLVSTTDTGYASYNAGGGNALDETGIPSQDVLGIEKKCAKSKENKDGTASPAACPKKKGSSFVRNATSVVQYFSPNEALHFNGHSGAGSPFHSLNCRLVLAYGVNTGAIVKVLHHTVQAMKSVLPPNIGGSLGLKGKGGVPGYNPAKAEAHVGACLKNLKSYHNFGKKPSKLSFTVTYPSGSQDAANEQLTIQHYLNKIKGVHESVKSIDANTWYGYASQDENNESLSILSNGWQEDFPDGFDYETLLLGAGQNYNIGNWEDPFLATAAERHACDEYNKLVNEAASSFNQSQRTKWYQQAGEIALKQAVWITRFNSLGFGLVRSTVHGFIGSPQYGELVPTNDEWGNISVS